MHDINDLSEVTKLVNVYFDKAKFDPRARSHAGMLASEAYKEGLRVGIRISELAGQLKDASEKLV